MFATIIAHLYHLRPAFSRQAPFLWICLFIVGMCVAHDTLGGASPATRVLHLGDEAYLSVLNALHSSAIDLDLLVVRWHDQLVKMFAVELVTLNGRRVYIVDAIKNPKEGRHMPGVKKMFQESTNNSKPEYFRGHFIQVIGSLIRTGRSSFCLPFCAKIHEGFKLVADDPRKLKAKFADLAAGLPLAGGVVIGDAWYAAATIINRLPEALNLALITRVAKNAVGYRVPMPEPKRRGPKRKYGEKVLLMSLFATAKMFDGQILGADGDQIAVRYWCQDLMWMPLRKYVRFVGCEHPEKGRLIALATDVTMMPLDVIQGYTFRFRIELAFKVGVHTLRTFGYRYWSKTIDKLPRFPEAEKLYERSPDYVDHYLKKIATYELHMLVGFIAQGLLVYLSVHCADTVRANLRTWFRTIRQGLALSETIVAESLRTEITKFTKAKRGACAVTNFIAEEMRKAKERMDNQSVRARTG